MEFKTLVAKGIPAVVVANIIRISSEQASRRLHGPRRVNSPELIYQISGTSSYIDHETGQEITCTKDTVLYIPTGRTHTYSIDSPRAQVHCVHFIPTPIKQNPYTDAALIPADKDPEILGCFGKLARSMSLDLTSLESNIQGTVCMELLLRLDHHQSSLQYQAPQAVQRALSYIESHLDGDLSRSRLSQESGVTGEHLSMLFKKHLNLTPSQLITTKRMDKAYRILLEEGEAISQTAYRVGYEDPLYFSKVFKKRTGMTPSEVRNF